MASELYQSFGKSANNAQVQQNPRDAAMSLLKQRGINVPANIANNPQAIIQHLVGNGTLNQGMVQNIMQRMFRR